MLVKQKNVIVPNIFFLFTIFQNQSMFMISVENMRKLVLSYSQGYASAALWSSKFGIFLQSCLTEVRDQRKKEVMMIGVIKNYIRLIFNFYYDCILVRVFFFTADII